MSDEWTDDDDPKVRALCRYALRPHVRYQDGRYSLAPTLVFADADYEVGDGICGLHSDGKQANEPAIVYTRMDALIDANDRIEELEAKLAKAVEALDVIAGRNDYADDPWGVARTILEELKGREDD